MNHRCSWPGCRRRVLLSRWGCHMHWYMLPRDIRLALSQAYRDGTADGTHPTDAYRQAYTVADRWIGRAIVATIEQGARDDQP